MTCVRGSSRERAEISRRSASLHSACAPMKSMPCFLRLAADFAGSNSKSTGIESIPTPVGAPAYVSGLLPRSVIASDSSNLSTGRHGRGRKTMRKRLGLSLFAGCVALLSAGGAGAQAPSAAVQAIPASTPEAPRDADGNLMTGKPFVACGPTTGSQIGILPNSVRNTSAQNAAAPANAGRGAVAGANAAAGTGRAQGAATANPAAGGRGAAATPRPTTTDPAILAGMRAAVDPRGGNGGLPNACNWADNTGFTSIFDGTLRGWEGD